MADVLLTHSYHLPYDPKQVRKMQPYAPLGTLYAASALRAGRYLCRRLRHHARSPRTGLRGRAEAIASQNRGHL